MTRVKEKEAPLSQIEMQALKFIRNTITHFGVGPSVRDLAKALEYSSPRSAAVIIQKLTDRGYLTRRSDGHLQLLRSPTEGKDAAQTVEVPLVGSVACGTPFLAQENVEAMISVSTKLARPPHRYFLLRAKGDSMNRAGIDDGSLVLVRQQQTADNGKIVVALIDDEATIKELHISREAIALKPRSTNPEHKPIILTRDFRVQGVVVTALSGIEA